MATLAELLANVEKIKGFVEVYLDVPELSEKQKNALKVDLVRLSKNLDALAAYAEPAPAVQRVAETPFDAPPIDPAYFVPVEEGAGDEVYIAGLEGGLPGEGVDWTLNRAIAWFTYVWTNGIHYGQVAPGLLPGSHCLTPEGYDFAVEFLKRDDLTVAPRDFNPLGLEVHP